MKRYIIMVLILGFGASGIYLFKNRDQNHWYHLAYYYLLGDRYVEGDGLRKFYSNQEETHTYKDSGLLKWYFCPDHLGNFCLTGLSDDIDNDGIAEVFVSGDSKKVYCLNGMNGDVIWMWTLPFGKASEFSYFLIDTDRDSVNELIVGTCGSTLPNRVYCLRTGKDLIDREIWHQEVSGDFIQGGLTGVVLPNGDCRIVVATRDAPYSRGSLNVLDQNGEHIFPSINPTTTLLIITN